MGTVATAILLTQSLIAQQPSVRARRHVAVRAAQMIDPVTGTTLPDPVVLIADGRVTNVGSRLPIQASVEVIDLGSATILPGLIDMHTHVTFQPGENYYADLFRRSPIDQAVIAHLFAQRTLEAGFTTIRDLGSMEYIDVALRNAIDRGEIPGPRMAVATLALGSTGGHNDLSGFSPYLRFTSFFGIADGVNEIQKLVRTEIKYGADVVKFMATAGVISEEESVGAPQYSQEEMNAIVQEAAMWGKRVAAHAHGAEGIKRAIRAGVASIEHASLIDDDGIRLALERGTYLVMDIYNDDYIVAEYKHKGYPDKILEKNRLVGQAQRQNFRKAVQAGVKMAYGTDAGVYPHGWNGKQFAKMVEWGMSPMQALQAATTNAAALLGWTDRVGSIQSGRYADIVAVRGDPLRDITELERVVFVMKGGLVFKDQIRPAGKN